VGKLSDRSVIIPQANVAQKRRVSRFLSFVLQIFDRSRWMRDRSIARDPTTQDNTNTPTNAYVKHIPSEIQSHDLHF
jgi:hypothetical protein